MQISATSPSVLALGLFMTGFGLGPGTSSEIVLLTETIRKNLYIYINRWTIQSLDYGNYEYDVGVC